MSENWENVRRPGYFGRSRDQKFAALDAEFGQGNWRVRWCISLPAPHRIARLGFDFEYACKNFYEMSYLAYLIFNSAELDYICSFEEVIDNGISNITSGFDYNKQESNATHIQDIAIRKVLKRLGLHFRPSKSAMIDPHKVLVVRGPDTSGGHLNPGQVPFIWPHLIEMPSMRPDWAKPWSVEDFWQSNKYIQVRR